MPTEVNYLLGQGERYADNAKVYRGHGEKKLPYTFDQAKARLVPQLAQVATAVAHLSPAECPNDEAVAAITVNPEFLAKSSYPDDLIREAGLRAIGSKSVTVTPERTSKKGKRPTPTP